MDTQSIQLFIEVARRGSFATVARDRDLDPSSVSRAVAGLERELGTRLFQRTTRRLSLTEAGHLFLARMEVVAEELEGARDALAALGRGPVGSLRLTASTAFGQTCLVPLLPAFQERFPELRLELILTDATLDLVEERIDLAVRLGPAPTGDLVARRLFATRYHVVASPDWVNRQDLPTRPDALQDMPCLRFALPRYRTCWRFRDTEGATSEVSVSGGLVISSALALRDAARAGLGPCLLADWLVGADLKSGELVDLFPSHQVTATTFETAAWLLYSSRTYLPYKVRSTVDFLLERLSSK